ncbi:hypothetical protein KIPB_014146, partial [Kipferlia bialata]|eukprot:g14146.t1
MVRLDEYRTKSLNELMNVFKRRGSMRSGALDMDDAGFYFDPALLPLSLSLS